jgi:uncharacterized protein (DUF1697 family)
MEKMILLLRGINVGGNNRLPMAELRDACREAGLDDIETYIQSGNLVFSAESAVAAEKAVEAVIADRFGMTIGAIARSATTWAGYARKTPFADADERGNLVHLGLSKKVPNADIVDRLTERAIRGETVVIEGDAIWIDFNTGVADTKLTPAFIDKVVGSTVTMRNWRTVRKLAEMAGV